MGEQAETEINPMEPATPEEFAEWKRAHVRLLDYGVTLENPLKMIALIEQLTNPTWTDETPTIPGCYWMAGEELDCATIVEVVERNGHSGLWILSPDTCAHTKRHFLMVEKLGRGLSWSGPIPYPSE